jgi:hypothetical protein
MDPEYIAFSCKKYQIQIFGQRPAIHIGFL